VLGLQIVDLEYGGYQAHGLPAIRGDGAEVLALSAADDGGRGYLTMSALVLDGKTGKVRERIPLVDANETWDAMRADEDAGGSVKADALARRVRAGVAALGARLATGSWRPLVSYPATSFNPDGEPPPFVTIADATFTLELRAYRGGRARVARVRAARPPRRTGSPGSSRRPRRATPTSTARAITPPSRRSTSTPRPACAWSRSASSTPGTTAAPAAGVRQVLTAVSRRRRRRRSRRTSGTSCWRTSRSAARPGRSSRSGPGARPARRRARAANPAPG
jgi:hypothetical protein